MRICSMRNCVFMMRRKLLKSKKQSIRNSRIRRSYMNNTKQ